MLPAAETGKRNVVKHCTTFEPQQWRNRLCKNCFRTAEQHLSSASTETTWTDLRPGGTIGERSDFGDTNEEYHEDDETDDEEGSSGDDYEHNENVVDDNRGLERESTTFEESQHTRVGITSKTFHQQPPPSAAERPSSSSSGATKSIQAANDHITSLSWTATTRVSSTSDTHGPTFDSGCVTSRQLTAMNEDRKLDREHLLDGGSVGYNRDGVHDLQDKVSVLDERNAQLDREKAALADLLAAKKREYDQMRQHYRDRVADLEDETQRLKAEKLRLVDKLQLPESERASLVAQENEIAKLRKRLEDAETRCGEIADENTELKREVKDLQLEMEEMHDQFRDEETAEFRELQRELETTAKACRIVNFKLRKAERRCEQVEAERVQAEEKARLLEARFRTTDDRQHIMELEQELRMAKEVSVRLHDDVEAVEEKRARYEEELDRVNDMLTESESRRQTLQKEVDMLVDQLKRYQSNSQSPGSVSAIDLSKLSSRTSSGGDVDISQVMRDLTDSLERENDLKEQLRFSEEEGRVMRKKLSDIEEENESLTLQLHKISSAKTGRFAPSTIKKTSSDGGATSPGDNDSAKSTEREREHELRLQMELAEQEVKVLRRKLDSVERSYDVLLDEVRAMRVRVEGRDATGGGGSSTSSAGESAKTHDEKVQELVRDIERLKWKLIEKDKDAADKALARRSSGTTLQKSRSLEEDHISSGTGSDSLQQFDPKMTLDTVRQEAQVLRDKLDDVNKVNEQLANENKRLQILAGRASRGGSSLKTDDEMARLRELETENAGLRDRISQLDERNNSLAKEIIRAKFRGQQQQLELTLAAAPGGSTVESSGNTGESSTAWRELRGQVQFLDDECRGLRRKIVDLEAERSKLKLELTHSRGVIDPKHAIRAGELDKESKDQLKKRILELENEIADSVAVVRNREEEAERMSEELAESREDLTRMLDSFRHRERALLDDVETLRHRNATLSDLLDLVTERAESAQKELDRYRAAATGSDGSTSDAITAGGGQSDALLQKDSERRVAALERQLAEEKRRVQAAEKKLKMVDVPLSEVKDDVRLRQHEKEILVQELALSQKQLKAADDQISELKQRLLTIRESHDDIKEDFAKVSKELAQAREQSVGLQGQNKTAVTGSAIASRVPSGGTAIVGKTEREPASWRWEKQELERQLKDYKKKLDDIFAEMKRNQVKWKAAGEDIARENQIKEELEKKIEKLREQSDGYKTEVDQSKVKVEELQESLRRNQKQWDKERQMLEADKMAAENDARQKDDVIRSKDELIAQKNQLVAEKDSALKDRSEALQQKENVLQQKELELEFKDRELRMRTDEVSTFRSELAEYRTHLAERDERIRQLDEHIRRRDDRLKEKDDILQQINRRLVEKANQVSDMDKTIRQVIRKLQARDVDLGFCNAELRRVQAELKTLHERLGELRRYADALESDLRRQTTEHESRVNELELKISAAEKDKLIAEERAKQAKQDQEESEERWKKENDEIQVELKLTTERLHIQDVTKSMGHTEAFKQMMKEKEALITERYKLNDTVNQLKRQSKSAEDKWNTQRSALENVVEEKKKALEEAKCSYQRLQVELTRIKESGGATAQSTGVAGVAGSSQLYSSSTDGVTRSELDRRERQWQAERATLEEYYEAAARTQSETVSRLRDASLALRRENDGQLQLLQSARKALGELRNRFDLASAQWNDERVRLDTAAEPVERYRTRLVELEQTVDRLTTELHTSEVKRKEAENRMITEQLSWKTERSAHEDKMKKLEQSAAEGGGKTSSSSSSASTRVSEFRSKFEKFGSLKSRKADDQFRSVDVADMSRDLERQIAEIEAARAEERRQLLERIETQRTELEKENKELRERNAGLEKKSREWMQMQRSVVDLQYRLVEDRSQWQLEVSQLQRHLEDTKRNSTQQKESINLLLAEIARLRVLVGAIDSGCPVVMATLSPDSGVGLTAPPTSTAKPRLRSLTPSAEKLRIRSSSIGSNGTQSSDQTSTGIKDVDQNNLQDLLQAIESMVRLADELRQPSQSNTPRSGEVLHQRTNPLTTGFKRSLSSAEFEISSASARVLALPSDINGSGYYSSRGSITSSASPSVPATRWRIGSRSSSQDDPTSGGSDYASESLDSRRQNQVTAASPATNSTSVPSNRGSIYASGTRSAYGSRDASPDTSGKGPVSSSTLLRKFSPYPIAPPSMIITPSLTPRRAESVDPDGSDTTTMTSADIQRLYERLNAIERETKTDLSFAASALGGGLDTTATTSSSATERRGRTMLKSASTTGTVGDQINAPITATMAAKLNFAIGQTSATTSGDSGSDAANGGRKITVGAPTISGRSASVSPRSARRQFFEDYSTRHASSGITSGANGGTSASKGSNQSSDLTTVSGGIDRSERSASVTRVEDHLHSSSSSKSSSSKISAAASSFFQKISDRRKLFGGKKSASVDNNDSVTGTSIARIGANVLTEPAAPSTYLPPVIPEPPSSRQNASKVVGKLHRRTASIDLAGGLAGTSGSTVETDRRERSSSATRESKHRWP